jgi:exosortase family protein XrtF
MWQEFKPTIYFLLRFFGTYAVLSILYGLFIRGYDVREPAELDSFTRLIVNQVGGISTAIGYDVDYRRDDHLNYVGAESETTYDSLYLNGQSAIAVEEGCNGLNVMILFVAFILAFGGQRVRAVWFIPLGLVIIHLSNLARLLALAVLNVDFEGRFFHFFHKYGFTAVIYAVVFVLWFTWVQFVVKSDNANPEAA